MSSEIAHIRKQIELECTAMVHASMYATTTSHNIINNKYKSLETLVEKLKQHLPKEQAIQTLIEVYDQSIEHEREMNK
jgi:predicted transcriptional regulator YdeE